MKKIIIAVILIFSIRGYAQSHTASWSGRQLGSDSVTRISYLFFADSLAGYMGCTFFQYSFGIGKYTNRWYRTLDGGLSWTPITYVSGYNREIGGQACAPSHNSIFLTDVSQPYNIYRSLDNGDDWDRIPTNLDLELFFTMFTEKNGIGIGGSQGLLFVVNTYDGGNTFRGTYHDSLFTASLAAGEPTGYQAQFSSELHGTYSIRDASINNGNGLTTLVTYNGALWEKHHTDFPAYQNYDLSGGIQYQKGSPNLWLLPGGDWYLNSVYSTSRSVFYRLQPDFNINYCFSTDYGVTWGYDTSFVRKSAVFYGVSPGNIWMTLHDGVEVNDLFPSYKIAHTTDFGKSWDIDVATLNNDGQYDAQAIYFTDANHGWIVAIHGGKPYIFIYHPLKNSVIEHHIALSIQLAVFPDPATNQVTINLPQGYIPMQALVYDIVGRQYFPPCKIQNNTVLIDTRDLPNGIWLALVKHTYGTNTSRFILQK